MKEETNKTKWLHVRLTEEEYDQLQKQYKDTTCRKLSDYIRKKLFDKHLTLYYRNRSLDELMAELMPLRKSLFAISNNFNQAVHKLNSMRISEYAESWIRAFERSQMNIVEQVEQANSNIKKFAEKWLQNSRPDHL